MQHQVGVEPTHIAPVRSGVPLSCKGFLRVLTQTVPVVNFRTDTAVHGIDVSTAGILKNSNSLLFKVEE